MRHATSVLLLLLAACGGGASGSGGAAPPPPTTCPMATALSAPRFGADILPMLQSTCGGTSAATSCHGGAAPPGKVVYATGPARSATDVWNDLVDAVPANAPLGVGWKRIAKNDVAHSWLIEKVTQDDPGSPQAFGAYGARMPYSLPNLCAATVQTLKNWIDRGAPND